MTPTGVVDDAVIEISGSRVLAIGPYAEAAGLETGRIAGWVVPGFIDTHVHGGGGHDYATEDAQEALRGRDFHAAYGTTTSFASLVTAPIDVLCRQLTTLADLVDDGHFAGVHLEGPFLSPDRRGAHDPTHLRAPDPVSVARLLKAARGTAATVTIAPELPGATAAIAQFLDAGVQVAVGHTDADRDTIAAALNAGASLATHLFNAMPSIHHRTPGPIPLLLADPRVGIELIADGFHLHPDVLRMSAAAAGPDRVMLVTDAMVAAGMPDGEYTLGGLQVRVRGSIARIVDGSDSLGSIAGSTLTMAGAFAAMTSIVGDIGAVAAMASTTAAAKLGLEDVGRIEAGARADLCVVDDRGILQRVMQSGEWRPESASA